MEIKRYRWLSMHEPCPWNLTSQEIEAGWHFCCFYGFELMGGEVSEVGRAPFMLRFTRPEIPSYRCKCQNKGRESRLIRRAWKGFEPLHSDSDGWETQIGLARAGRCFKRYRDNSKPTYIWQNWRYIGRLDDDHVKDEIAKCFELDLKDFQWQIDKNSLGT